MRQKCKRVLHDESGCCPVMVLVIGYLSNNCYIISDGDEPGAPTILVDPAGDPDAIMQALEGKDLQYIFLTHNHPDHVLALPQIVAETHAQVLISEQDAHLIETGQPELFRGWGDVQPVLVDRKLHDGDIIEVGSMKFEAILTPGHTLGGMCLYSRGEGKPGVLFTGDTLFYGTTGRMDFAGGSETDMRWSLRNKLAPLPDDTIVYPGHEAFTTIGAERVRVLERF